MRVKRSGLVTTVLMSALCLLLSAVSPARGEERLTAYQHLAKVRQDWIAAGRPDTNARGHRVTRVRNGLGDRGRGASVRLSGGHLDRPDRGRRERLSVLLLVGESVHGCSRSDPDGCRHRLRQVLGLPRGRGRLRPGPLRQRKCRRSERADCHADHPVSYSAPCFNASTGPLDYTYSQGAHHPLYLVLYWANNPGDGSVKFNNVQIYYHRIVSPAPANASFADVPTGHAFFQFIEAFKASGITGGCGGNNFCPDSPLTRGQMAVFLAKALGLHWPN